MMNNVGLRRSLHYCLQQCCSSDIRYITRYRRYHGLTRSWETLLSQFSSSRAAKCYGRWKGRLAALCGGGVGVSVWALSLWTRRADSAERAKNGAKNADETNRRNYAIIKKADELYNNYLIDNVYSGLIRFAESENAEMLWRLARATCERAKLTRSKDQKKELFLEAFHYIEKALECQPPEGIFAVHKWYAILLNYKLEYEGIKQQLKRSLEVKDHLEKALQLNETDPTTWHILGLWHFTFADLPSYQRHLAKLIFGSPPESTYDAALEYFLRAEKLQERFYSKNSLMIAKILLKQQKQEEAIPYLQDAFKRIVVSADDYEAHCEADKLLKRLGLNKY